MQQKLSSPLLENRVYFENLKPGEKHIRESDQTKLVRQTGIVNHGEVVIGNLYNSLVALFLMKVDTNGRSGALMIVFLFGRRVR